MNEPEVVTQRWIGYLPFQQQSVLILALRGPDEIRKYHPMKDIQRHYRGTVLVAARKGRPLRKGESADTFMSLEFMRRAIEPTEARPITHDRWAKVIKEYLDHIDEMPLHFHLHLMHGAEILAYKHPDIVYRDRWMQFYYACVDDMHLNKETEEQLDRRLCDWNREFWDDDEDDL